MKQTNKQTKQVKSMHMPLFTDLEHSTNLTVPGFICKFTLSLAGT